MSLGLSPGAAVFRFDRIRFADEEPMALEYSAIAGDCLPGVDAVVDSLYAALDTMLPSMKSTTSLVRSVRQFLAQQTAQDGCMSGA